jgi:hypothetical protein
MNRRKQLIKEIEEAPDSLVEEVLDFLLFTKSRKKDTDQISNRDLGKQLREMAEDPEVQVEINAINEEFLVTEMDGLK